MQMQIRELSSENVHEIARCDDSFEVDSRLALHARDGALRYTIVPVPPYRKRYPQDDVDYRQYMGREDRAVFLAYVDGQPAGHIRLRENWNRLAYVENIAVDVRFRRQGVGSALMRQASAWARAGRLCGIMLETQDNNVAACRFYERCGFVLGGFDRMVYRGLKETDEVALYWYLLLGAGAPA